MLISSLLHINLHSQASYMKLVFVILILPYLSHTKHLKCLLLCVLQAGMNLFLFSQMHVMLSTFPFSFICGCHAAHV